jgi:magnesium-transporting ATPase (P-type)
MSESTTTGGASANELPAGAQAPPSPPWHALEKAEVEARLGTGPRGLSEAEAQERLARTGPNQLEEIPPPSALSILLHQFKNPLIYILLVATVVTLALGEYIDSGVIAAVLALNAIIGFTQERKAEVSVRSLMRLLSPKAHFIRDGKEWERESRELVPGDLVLLESGVRVPADLRLVSTAALAVDESLFTGESVPASKQARPLGEAVTLADRANMAYTGTVVTTGRARGYVVATGPRTELGAIAGEMRQAEKTETPLQQRMNRLTRLIGIVVAIAAVGGFVLGVLLGHAPADMFMLAVALAVAAIPEGLPVVFTITLAIGVNRMARRRAIIRRLPAVETLGSTTVIGSDKTGTLTENRMTVEEIWAGGRFFPVPGTADGPEAPAGAAALVAEHRPLRLTLLSGVLTNEAEVYATEHGAESRGDPTEVALLVAAERMGIGHEDARADHASFAEIPFEPERQYSASVRSRDGRYLVFVKGAPERLLPMCTSIVADEGARALSPGEVLGAAREMAARGLRVLAMAHAEHPEPPHGPEEVRDPEGLSLVGLVGMMDPPRAGVREAIAGCRAAGIRVAMITGDHAATAESIARQLGISTGDAPVLTGAELSSMDDDALAGRVQEVSVFARVAPEQKLRVVRALRAQGEVVAVTGDGVNDAPALKAADIGIAMGKSGTDVAREASDMVLADDNFVSIQAAVEEGRITFDNLRKVTFFLVSTGAGTILTILAALALGWPIPFVPAQLLWLNLVTNGLQDVALAFEPGEKGVLERPPRPRSEGVVSALLWERTVVVGVVMAVGTLALFRWELEASGALPRAQTVALTTAVFFQMFQVGNSRSEFLSIFQKNPFSNPFLFLATGAALLVHVGALNLGATQFVLRVVPIGDAGTWVRMLLVAATAVVAVELHKLLRRSRRPAPAPVSAPG